MSSNRLYRLLFVVIAFRLLFTAPNAQGNTDIHLIDIKVEHQRVYMVSAKNLTSRPGYDNQPHFSSDNKGLFFTEQSNNQTDILYYDLASNQVTNITNTPQTSEYSPTPIAASNRISFIKVETDGTQRLWQQEINSGTQSLVMSKVKPVGYHAWGRNNDLALFILGEPMTLQYSKATADNSAVIVDHHIGRAIHYNAALNVFSYTKGDNHILTVFNPETGNKQTYLPLPEGSQDYTWLTPNEVLSAQGSNLVRWDIQRPEQGWQPFLTLSSVCSTPITRIAVNSNGKQIAIVCDERVTTQLEQS